MRQTFLGIAGIMLSASASSGALAQSVPRNAPISGTIASAKGGEQAVLVPERTWRAAVSHQQLKAGDVLRTNATGTLAIVFADRTQIRLGPNSILAVKAVSAGVPSSLQLQQGRVWARSPSGRANLSVETPSATAAIRGTEWVLSIEGDATMLQVFAGEIRFFNEAGALDVVTGQGAAARPGQAPTRTVLADPVGRAQMLYFLRPEDGLAMMRGKSAVFAGYVRAVREGGNPPEPALDRDDPLSWIGAGFLAAYRGDMGEARRIAAEGLARFPDEAGLYELTARAAILEGDGAGAMKAVQAALVRNPRDPAALALRAELEADYAGEPYAALASAQAAVAADPGRAASYAILADIRAERGAERETIAALRRAITLDPENAALHARLASAYLQQNRVGAARREIDRAEALDPTLAIVRTVRGQYLVQRGRAAEAEQEVLAASADNPGYARALVQLAEIGDRLDDDAGAQQQLDAADRLDPEDSRVPIARTAIAIDQYRSGEAILSAREALRRFQARGGVYSSLSEDRATGSHVSRAFRFAGMDDWGRYYGDRVFDSFTPTSYFDQALNRTPDPFVGVDFVSVGFDADNGDDLGQLSSFLQGLSLDPLAVSAPRRHVQFSHEAFIEGSVEGGYRQDRFQNYPSFSATLDGLSNVPVPFAYSLAGGHRRAITRLGNEAFEYNTDFVQGFLGVEPLPYDKIVGFVRYERSDNAYGIPDNIPPLDYSVRSHDLRAFGFLSHDFGARNTLTIGYGHGDRRSSDVTWQRDPSLLPVRFATGRNRSARFDFGSAVYTRSIGRMDVKAGAEGIWSYSAFNLFNLVDLGPPDGLLQFDDVHFLSFRQRRLFVDARWAPRGPLLFEGQIGWADTRVDTEGYYVFSIDDAAATDEAGLTFRGAVAYEPRKGHWLRATFLREASSEVPFTFVPTGALGLRGNIAPVTFGGRSDSAIARWDAEWSRHVFTSLEAQHQRFARLIVPGSDDLAFIGFDDVSVDRVRATVNIWPGGNLGLAATYAWTRGHGSQLQIAVSPLGEETQIYVDTPLPFLPEHFAQASLTWTAPGRVRLVLRESYSANQRDYFNDIRPASFLTDVEMRWEPLDKRIDIGLSIENLFGTERTPRFSIGRVVTVSAAVRF